MYTHVTEIPARDVERVSIGLAALESLKLKKWTEGPRERPGPGPGPLPQRFRSCDMWPGKRPNEHRVLRRENVLKLFLKMFLSVLKMFLNVLKNVPKCS